MIFPEHFEEKIGFDRVRKSVRTACMTDAASDLLEHEGFLTDPEEIRMKLGRIKEFILMSDEEEFVMEAYVDIRIPLSKLKVPGNYLETSEVADLRKNLHAVRAILNFFKKTGRNDKYHSISEMCSSVTVYPFIQERIDKVLSKQGRLRDQASRELARIRNSLSSLETQVSRKLQSILKKIQQEGTTDPDTSITIRNGRPVIPLPSGKKRQLTGIIHDESASGKTVFVEPSEVVGINNEIRELEYAEQREIIRILTELTKDLQPYAEELGEMAGFLASMDLVQAKVKYAKSIRAVMPEVVGDQLIEWKKAVHPILYLALKKEKRKVVPLDISLTRKARILVISGPNAGGKSVCLKTVGLLQYMVQCGFPVPMNEDSKVGIFHRIFIDIGDEQSIENDLSTYSSHLLNMKSFIRNANETTLLLIDEFGTGTEPVLGGAIAEVILDRLNGLQTWGVVTTHYSNLKHFAADAPGIENGAMLFDTGQMQPLYRLEIGQPGSSFAFEIARNIGLPEDVIKSASEKVGVDHIQFDKHLREIIRDKKYWESKRDKIRLSEKKLQETLGQYARELELTERTRKEIIKKAEADAEELLREANRKIENTIRQIRESQAEKERTRKAREDLRKFREKPGIAKGEKGEVLQSRVDKLRHEEQKVKLRRQKFGQAEPSRKTERKSVDLTIRVGDFVLMKGQEIPGEVLERKGNKLSVRFGHLTTRVDVGKLEKIEEEEFRNHEKPVTSGGDYADWDVARRKIQFHPEIDVRGQRAEETLRNVAAMMDEAIMVECRELRIVHGKGDGILRQVIRQYLASTDLILSAEDEHVDLGGAGVTIVLLDI